MKKKFSKDELRNGDKVTCRGKLERIVEGNRLLDLGGLIYNDLTKYNNDLTSSDGAEARDIIKVERTTTIFERVEPIELVRGEIYANRDRMLRFDSHNGNNTSCLFSQLINDNFFYAESYYFMTSRFNSNNPIATPQQKATLIKAEIENGYLWDENKKELIKFDKNER